MEHPRASEIELDACDSDEGEDMKSGIRVTCAMVLSFALGMVLQSARAANEAKENERVTGVGGFFLKAQNPGKLADWYRDHLGIALQAAGQGEQAPRYYPFKWREKDHPDTVGSTVWSIFPEKTNYFGPGDSQFMINFRVANLDRLLAELRQEGVTVIDKVDAEANGKFGWAVDPEGHRIELWEPKGE
jgi:predicted enzyme related to lactoylglutathione lyase